MKLPILGITMGDPAGIGPEISVKALARQEIYQTCKPIIIGDAGMIAKTLRDLSLSFEVNPVHKIEDAKFSHGTMDVYNLRNVDLEKLHPGEVSDMAGRAAFEAVKTAIDLALAKKLDGTVTGPINKEALNNAGYRFSGHTEIYAHFTGVKKYAMLLVERNLKVIHVSTHVPLKTACDLVKKDRIVEVIQLLNDACIRLGTENPRIGVAGLNPHASDGGLFGREEAEEIVPAILEAKNLGIHAMGPVPPDTLFTMAAGGAYDGCVAMYHDQGHIPFKMIGFNWDERAGKMKSVRGVNITLGLPIIRTSVDHGTAFEIAGKGLASPDALILAIEYARKLALHQN